MSGLALALGFGMFQTVLMPVAKPTAPPFQFITTLEGQQVTTPWPPENKDARELYDARVVSSYVLKGSRRMIEATLDFELRERGYRCLSGRCLTDGFLYTKNPDMPVVDSDRFPFYAAFLSSAQDKDSSVFTIIRPPSDREYSWTKLGRQIMISLSPR